MALNLGKKNTGVLQAVAGGMAAAASAAVKKNASTGAAGGNTGGGRNTSPSGGGFQPYTGGNTELDGKLKGYSDAYNAARANGDINGMRDANDSANQLRNQYGFASQNANTDIEYMKGQTGYYDNTGGSSGGQGGGGTRYQSGGADILDQWKAEQDRLYAEQQRRLEEANRAAVERAVGSLNAQRQGVDQSYSDLFKELYVQRRMSEKNLPQQMAAMGYSGGLSESTALNLQNSYADSLRKGEQERLNTMSDIDRAVTDARLQGDADLANQAAQLAQNKLSSYGDLVQAQLAQMNWENQFGYQQGQDALSQDNWNKQFGYQQGQDSLSQSNWDKSFAYQKAQDEWSKGETSYQRKLELAQIMAQYGDFSGFEALGVDPSTMKSTYASALNKGSGGGSGGGSGKPRLTASQAMDAWNAGMATPEVRAAIEYYYGNVLGDTGPAPTVSPAYNEISNKISLAADRLPENQVPAEALRLIRNAVQQGLLTDSEARRLAGQYGISL